MKREFTEVGVGVEVVIGAGGVIGGLCGVGHGFILGGFRGALCSFVFEAYLRVQIVVVSHCFFQFAQTRERERVLGIERKWKD